MNWRNVPTRLATGAYILNSGVGKMGADEETAAFIHGSAAAAYPFLEDIPPARFIRGLAIAEVTVGSILLAPFIPSRLAGAALTAFSGGLVGMYLRTPALRLPGSIRPSQAGSAIAKDTWMLGIGLGMLIDACCDRKRTGKRCCTKKS